MEQVEDIRIEPSVVRIADTLHAHEIVLGGQPRGALILINDIDDWPELDGAMNDFAAQGYESLGVTAPEPLDGTVDAALNHLANRGWSPAQVGMVGFGRGAEVVLAEATRRDLGAAVSLAGSEEHMHDFGRPLRTPWLGLFGGAPERLRLGRDLYERARVHTETVIYPSADRAFSWSSAQEPHHPASFDAWQRAVEWLNRRVGPPRRESA